LTSLSSSSSKRQVCRPKKKKAVAGSTLATRCSTRIIQGPVKTAVDDASDGESSSSDSFVPPPHVESDNSDKEVMEYFDV
jgi:hypothetical protein